MVPRPWVSTWRGTSSTEAKKRALSSRVAWVKRLEPGAGAERGSGLVEADVAVGADAEQLEVDASGSASRRS